VFRLVAVDDRGQEGWDDVNWTLAPPAGGDIRFTGDFSPIRRVGENFDVPVSLDAILEYRLHLDDITDDVQLLGSSALSQGAGGLAAGSNRMPAVSSDLARYVVVVAGREHYSPYFTIRPKPELGDAPPMVQMLAPRPGSTHAGGSIVTIRWTADDTEGLRDFDIQASYDAGRTWHMVTKGLPPGTRSHAWQLPRSAGIPDVRLRVIARDTRFQVTSSGADHAFTIGPGDWTTACRADLNADGVVDGADLGAMLSGWGDPAAADITGDGNVDGADLGALLAVWGSCPT
jgi:hypothetical protein